VRRPPQKSVPPPVSASASPRRTTASESESTTTAPSLFGDENAAGADGGDGVDTSDFFSTVVPHTNYQPDLSVTTAVSSRPSSAASETPKAGAFNIYPVTASATDQLITHALVLGDLESAVSLCLASARYCHSPSPTPSYHRLPVTHRVLTLVAPSARHRAVEPVPHLSSTTRTPLSLHAKLSTQ
jgi:hypothetical protein